VLDCILYIYIFLFTEDNGDVSPENPRFQSSTEVQLMESSLFWEVTWFMLLNGYRS